MRQKIEASNEIDVTPMLDVVFILLIFFVVTTSFDRSSVVDVQRSSKSVNADAQPEPLVIRVQPEGLFFEGLMVTRDGLAGRLAAQTASEAHGLLIAADAKAPLRLLVAAIDAGRDAGFSPLETVLALNQ